MIVFTRTMRDRPLVLTRHQIAELSAAAGFDVHARLYELRNEWFEVKTLGQLMRALKERLSGKAPEHTASQDCWCKPEAEYVDPESGAKVWVHRQVQ